MKAFLILMTAAFSLVFLQEKPKLKGTYHIVFDESRGQQPFQMTFNDSTYSKRMPDAVTSSGKIVYEKYKVILRKNKEEDPIVIDSRDIGKDTIKFTIKSKADTSRNLYYGKMIRK